MLRVQKFTRGEGVSVKKKRHTFLPFLKVGPQLVHLFLSRCLLFCIEIVKCAVESENNSKQ